MRGDVVISPVATEKSMFNTEKENKLTFIVNRKANRDEIKKAVEELYSVKVTSVRTMHTKAGKKAIVQLESSYSADEIAGRIGIF